MINYDVFEDWREKHSSQGGKLLIIPEIRSLCGDRTEYILDLYKKFSKIPLSDVEYFETCEATDNSMPYRDILEDASKIYHLSTTNIKFVPQLVHEPWRSNPWRAHPGSGRYAALARVGQPVPGVYTYFNEPGFIIPDGSVDLTDLPVEDIISHLSFGYVGEDIDFTTYSANGTTERDGEWKPDREFKYQWEFLRYTEGKFFTQHKHNWRQSAVELWLELND